MDEYRLRMFFHGLLRLAWKHPGTIGNPCSWLLDQMCVRQEAWLDRIVGDYTGDFHECRLNRSGLKMYWKVKSTNPASHDDGFKCYISGDQAKDYPFFVAAANLLIKDYGFNHRDDPERLRDARRLLNNEPVSAPPVMVAVMNACLGCGVILEDVAQRYCLPCQTRVDKGVPVAEFGGFMPTLMESRIGYLLQSDVDILDDNLFQIIRPNVLEDTEVKRLYYMYKSL